jgi:hypothetical protein
MRALSATDLLTLWEEGQGRPPVERALMLLEGAYPELGGEALALLSIGQRDARLLALREQLFGPTLANQSTCPQCGESLEQTFTVEDIRIPAAAETPGLLSVAINEDVVHFRLPNSQDLAALPSFEDVRVARARLVERCLLASSPERAHPPVALSESVVETIAERMAQADPQGDIQLALSCPRCAREWVESFDIVSYLWSELAAWASRMLDQVHRLACVYGWREADILAMSAWRRDVYLCMVGP